MKSFECESSSEGDEPILPISRAVAESQQWLKGGATGTWGWQTSVSILKEFPPHNAIQIQI